MADTSVYLSATPSAPWYGNIVRDAWRLQSFINSYTKGSDGKFYKLDYTETDTTFTLKKLGLFVATTEVVGVDFSKTIKTTYKVSMTGQSDWSTNRNNYESYDRPAVTFNKTHSMQTITVNASLTFNDYYLEGNKGPYTDTSSTSFTFNIPPKTSYVVTYNENGGGTPPVAQAKWHGESLTLASSINDRDGWTITGWNTKADGSGTSYSLGGSYTNDEPITLYAQWTRSVESVIIDGAKVIRTASSSSTVENDEGNYGYITVPIVVKGSAKCTATLTVTATAASGSAPTISYVTRTAAKTAENDNDLIATLVAKASGCASDVKYVFTITVSVANNSNTQSAVTNKTIATMSSAFYTMDVLSGGHGVSFGEASTGEWHNVSMKQKAFLQPDMAVMTFSSKAVADATLSADSNMLPCIVLCLDDFSLWYCKAD